MAATIKNTKKTLLGLFAVDGNITETQVNKLWTRLIRCPTTASASTVGVSETLICGLKRAHKVKSAMFSSLGGCAAGSTSYATVTLYRNAAGTQTTVGTFLTTTALATATPAALTLVDTATACSASDCLTYAITNTGSGQALLAGDLSIELEEID